MQQRTSKWVRLGQVIRCRRFACIEARLYLARILHLGLHLSCVCFFCRSNFFNNQLRSLMRHGHVTESCSWLWHFFAHSSTLAPWSCALTLGLMHYHATGLGYPPLKQI